MGDELDVDHVGDGSKKPDVSDAGSESSDFKKLLNQLKKTKEENKSLAEQLASLSTLKDKVAQFEQDQVKKKEDELTQKGEYKTLLELREKEISDLKLGIKAKDDEVTSYRKDLHDTYKANAFNNALPGKLRNPDYLTFVDFDKIVFDPNTGAVDKQSVDAVVEGFMKNHGALVDTSSIKGMPSRSNTDYSGGAVDFSKMSLADMKKNLRSMVMAEKMKKGLI